MKKEPPKFSGPLAEPIVIPFEPPALGSTGNITNPHGLPDWLRKLELLQEHYGVKKGSDTWFELALRMAIDLVPGFRLVYDDPLAAAMGFPTKAGAKAGRKGTGAYPTLWGPRLLIWVDFMRRAGHDKSLWQTDHACAEFLFESFRPAGGAKLTRREQQAAIATIERRIRAARKVVQGPAHIVRGKSKLN